MKALLAVALLSLGFSLAATADNNVGPARNEKCSLYNMKLISFKEDVKDADNQIVAQANKAYLASGLSRYFREVTKTNFIGWTSTQTELKTFVIVTDMSGRTREISTGFLTTDSLLLLKMSNCE